MLVIAHAEALAAMAHRVLHLSDGRLVNAGAPAPNGTVAMAVQPLART